MTSAQLEKWMGRKLRLRHIEMIAEVYECRSILRASTRLNLTQSAVTKAVRDIEKTLALSLFERTNRGLIPTPYGDIFARHAKTVLAQLRHAAEELEHHRVGYSGHVTVGTLLTASARLLPEAILALKRDRPGVAITLIEGTTDVLLSRLIVGDLDVVVGRMPESGPSDALIYEEFYREPSYLVARKDHPIFRLKQVGLQDLVDEPWVLPVRETTLRHQIEKAFFDAKVSLPTNVIESVSILTNRVLLRQSDCIGVLPHHVAIDDVEHGILAIVPIGLDVISSPVGSTIRAPGDLPPAATAFLDCLRSAGKDIHPSLGRSELRLPRLSPTRRRRRKT